MAAMLLTLLPAGIRASALSDSGTKTSPYVVTTYDELRAALDKSGAEEAGETYIKLGNDISSEDTANNYNFNLSSEYEQYVSLDLAGHTLARTTQSIDETLFDINSNYTLDIDDSVGGGEMTYYNSHGTYAYLFWNHKGTLNIHNGTFISPGTNRQCMELWGGTTNIYGGKFYSDNIIIDHGAGYLYIYDGDFTATKGTNGNYVTGLYLSSNNGNFYIYNCNVYCTNTVTDNFTGLIVAGMGNASSNALKDHIPSGTAITADGKAVALADKASGVQGRNINLHDPTDYNVKINITEPANGNKVPFTYTNSNPNVELMFGLSWFTGDGYMCDENSVFDFDSNDYYRVTFRLRANSLYFLNNAKVTLNGREIKGERQTMDEYTYYYDFSLAKEPEYKLGDINADSSIDSKDAMLSIKYAKKGAAPKDEEQFKRADVNKDGVLDTKDSMILIKAAKKLITIE